MGNRGRDAIVATAGFCDRPRAEVWTALFPDRAGAAYALLDAAVLRNLPERLGASGLDHACLYRGDALDRLGDVAPWLVALDPDAPFARELLSEGAAPWTGWNTRFGWLLQTPAPLVRLRDHLRRFTMTEDEDGERYLFRFWDPSTSGAFLAAALRDPAEAGRWLTLAGGEPLRIVVAEPDGDVVAHAPGPDGARAAGAGPFRLRDGDRRALRENLDARDVNRMTDHFAGMDHFAGYDRHVLRAGIGRAFARRDRMRVRSPNGLAWLVILCVHETRQRAFTKWLDRIADGTGWTFDQIARVLQRKGGA